MPPAAAATAAAGGGGRGRGRVAASSSSSAAAETETGAGAARSSSRRLRRAASTSSSSRAVPDLPADLVLRIAACLRTGPPAASVRNQRPCGEAAAAAPGATRWDALAVPLAPPIQEPNEAPGAPLRAMRRTCRSWRAALDAGTRRIGLTGPEAVLPVNLFPLLSSIDARGARSVILLPPTPPTAPPPPPTLTTLRRRPRALASPSHPQPPPPSSPSPSCTHPLLQLPSTVISLAVDLCSDHKALLDACPHLEQLSVGGVDHSLSRSLSRSHQLPSALDRLHRLVALSLSWLDASQFRLWRSLAGLSQLQHLELEGCSCPWFLAPQFSRGGAPGAALAAAEGWQRRQGGRGGGAAAPPPALLHQLGERLRSLTLRR